MRSETFILSDVILILLPPQQATEDLENSVGVAVAQVVEFNKIPNSESRCQSVTLRSS